MIVRVDKGFNVEVRTRRRFAWLPVRFSDGVTVWLERYMAKERWGHNDRYVEVDRWRKDMLR